MSETSRGTAAQLSALLTQLLAAQEQIAVAWEASQIELTRLREQVAAREAERDGARQVARALACRAREYPTLTDLRKELLLAEQEQPWLLELEEAGR